jgi:purine nucleoside phosphorylase
MADTPLAEYDQTEHEKVSSWRLHVLMEAGYPLPLAERLAQSGADLHRAVELVHQGCTFETAAEILL